MTRLQIYAQLVRLPNLPSALSNICLGGLVVLSRFGANGLSQRLLPFLLLLFASAALYCSGMIWNDFFDLEQDKHERPFRPLPSGKISLREASLAGVLLLAAGVLFAGLAGRRLRRLDDRASTWTPLVLAFFLVAAILLYDGLLKRTWAGPVCMGLCRFLNVLLGVSLSGALLWPGGAHLAAVVGLYVVGLTWFARTEARQSRQTALRGAASVMLLSLLLALLLPLTFQQPHSREQVSSPLFPYLLVFIGFAVGLPVCEALASPTSDRVQAAVKRALLGLIVLDAVLASAVAGTIGLLLLLLLAPALYLNRRRFLYAT